MSRWTEANALHAEGLTGPVIAARLGVSRQRVHQLLNSPEPTGTRGGSRSRTEDQERIHRLGLALVAIERTRELNDRAAGEAFLPDGWAALVKSIRPLLDVAEAAHELVYGTTHANVTGAEYEDRKLYYEKVRKFLDRLAASPSLPVKTGAT